MNVTRQLRPLTVGDMLDQAFRLYRAHFVRFINIAAVLFAPMAIVQIVSLLLFQSAQVVALIQGMFIQRLVSAALILAISHAYLSGPMSVAEACGVSVRRYFSLLGAIFLEGLAIGIPAAVLGCGVVVTGSEWAAIFLLLLIVPYSAYLSTRWAVVMPSIIVEDVGATETAAFSRLRLLS